MLWFWTRFEIPTNWKVFFEGSRCTILFADAQFCFQPVDALKQGMEIMIIVRHETAQAISIDKFS